MLLVASAASLITVSVSCSVAENSHCYPNQKSHAKPGRTDNGRPGVEPVILLGVLIFQFLERFPDRQPPELVKYHLGWKLALNLALNFKGLHHTTLSSFRARLLANDMADLAMRIISKGLVAAGLAKKRDKKRLDSYQKLGAAQPQS